MSRYFFHSVTADGVLKDDIGVEVEDASIYREAIKAVFELEAEFGPRGEDTVIQSFWIVNEIGQTILELQVREAVDTVH